MNRPSKAVQDRLAGGFLRNTFNDLYLHTKGILLSVWSEQVPFKDLGFGTENP